MLWEILFPQTVSNSLHASMFPISRTFLENWNFASSNQHLLSKALKFGWILLCYLNASSDTPTFSHFCEWILCFLLDIIELFQYEWWSIITIWNRPTNKTRLSTDNQLIRINKWSETLYCTSMTLSPQFSIVGQNTCQLFMRSSVQCNIFSIHN